MIRFHENLHIFQTLFQPAHFKKIIFEPALFCIMYEADNSFLDWQLRKLRQNDEGFRSLSLNLGRMEKDFSQQLAHWRESLFSFQVTQWIAVIRQNNTVDTVTLDLSLSNQTIWKKDQLKGLIAAIRSLPRLCKLVLRQNTLGEARRLSSMDAIIGGIENNNSIECLELWGNEIALGMEANLKEFSQVVKTMGTLKSFKFLGFRLDPRFVQMFIPLTSMPSLTEFCLGNTSDSFVPIAGVLKSNEKIEKLTLCFVDRVEDQKISTLVQALRENTTLKFLSLLNASSRNNHSGISARSQRFLVELTRHNMILEDVKTRGQPPEDLVLFLKLNRLGRRHLFHMGTRERWVDALITSRHDLDCSFYFLSMNPSVFVSS